MPKGASKCLVIDASVALAAGKIDATSARSRNCREFLQVVLDISYRASLTPQLKDEWDRHQSPFARTWRRAMVSRRKLVIQDVPADTALRVRIERIVTRSAERAAVRKDYHLIEAALIMDRVIASLDETVRALFGTAAGSIVELRRLIWVNPEISGEICVAWLKDGARLERKRMLGFRGSAS